MHLYLFIQLWNYTIEGRKVITFPGVIKKKIVSIGENIINKITIIHTGKLNNK